MTVVEERLVRDIEAVTQDIVVTESNLVAARAAVSRRLDDRRRHDRRRTLVAAAAAALLIPALGDRRLAVVRRHQGRAASRPGADGTGLC